MTLIEPKLRKALTGISGILVTPFDAQDKVAPARLSPIINRAIGAGVHILVANGNTGEFYGLTTAEAEQMVHSVAEQIAGRVPLLAGVGRSINDACQLARASRAAGATALMVHQPPDPFVSPRGVVAYVQRIAEAGDVFRSCCTCGTTGLVSMPSSNCAKSPALLGSNGRRRRLCGSLKRSGAVIPTSCGLVAWRKHGLRRSAR
jgi:dihydrodipicolinate synthetase family protein